METIDLSDLFNTRSDADDFTARLTTVLKEVFATGFNPDKAFLEQFGIIKKEAFMTLLRNNNVNPQSRLAIKEFIEQILAKIQAMPVISMVLAFEPNQHTLQGLSRWFILNTKKQVLFDIKIDDSLIGGAAIMAGGKFYDFSIRSVFDSTTDSILFGNKPPQKANEVASK